MEYEGSLPRLKMPATCPSPEPDQVSPSRPSNFLKIHLNIIFPSKPGSSKWSLSLRFHYQNTICTSALPSTCYMNSLSHLITRIIFGEEYRSLSSLFCNFLHSTLTSFLLGQNILFSTLFSNTLSLRSSLNVTDHVSHPYTTTNKIIVLYIIIFIFLDINWKTKDSAPNDSKLSLNNLLLISS